MKAPPSGKPKKGPVVVIKEKTTSIPIYSAGEGKFIAAYYAGGKRKLVKYQSLELAKQGAKEIIQSLTTGVAHVAAFSPTQTALINDAIEMLRPYGLTVNEAVRQVVEAKKVLGGSSLVSAAQFFSKHLAEENRRGALVPITFPDLVTKYLDSIRGMKSHRYILDLAVRLKKAVKVFKGQVREIRADDIDQWLLGMNKVTGRTRNNYRMALLTVFSYARDKKHLPRGEKTEAEFATRFQDKGGDIGIYTPDQLRTLLTKVEPRFVPFVALGAFAGLRTIEILRLNWENIWFEKGVIEVGKDKAKTATRRLAPILPALEEWLKTHAQKTGPVLPGIPNEFRFQRLFKAATDKLVDSEGNRLVTLVHNGLRHSFCSYRLAITKSAAQVSLEAGNSPKMLFQNYRELVTEEAANEYFGILPHNKRNKAKKSSAADRKGKTSTKNLGRGRSATRAKGVKKLAPTK